MWQQRWALLAKVAISDRLIWYRFQYLDGTQRCIVADGKRNTIDEICAMLDDQESRRQAQRVRDLL